MGYAAFMGHDDGGCEWLGDCDEEIPDRWSTAGVDAVSWRQRARLVVVAYDELVTQTVKAALYRFGDREIWLPKSATRDDGQLSMPEWMADRNGLKVTS